MEKYRLTILAHTDRVRKAKTHLGLNLVRNKKSKTKTYSIPIGTQAAKERLQGKCDPTAKWGREIEHKGHRKG